jgi:hypothetical protein
MLPILPSSVTQGVLREVFKSLSLPLLYAYGGKATVNDNRDTSDDDHAVLDLEDDGVGDVQGTIILSEEDDSKFDDAIALVFKRRRIQHIRKAKKNNASSFALRGKPLQQNSSLVEQPPSEPGHKDKASVPAEQGSTISPPLWFTSCDLSIRDLMNG